MTTAPPRIAHVWHPGELVWVRSYNTHRAALARYLRCWQRADDSVLATVHVLIGYCDWDAPQPVLLPAGDQEVDVEIYRLEEVLDG